MMHGTIKQHYLAVSRLENPENYDGLPKLENDLRRLRIWRYPSFATISSWAVFGLGKNIVVRRLEWDRSTEFPSQTELRQVYGAQSSITENEFNFLMSELAEIEFRPLIEHQAVMCDGTEYGVEVGHGSFSRSISWHHVPSQGWEKLASWHQKAIEKLDSLLPESTCRLNEKNG
ncbi:MAG: hypothetical protein AB2735_03040 [Candidatus Thiodiazotropha taylori]